MQPFSRPSAERFFRCPHRSNCGRNADGRRGLCGALGCRFRVVGNRRQGVGEAVNATGLVANVLAGTLVVLLIVYLFVALIRPDKL